MSERKPPDYQKWWEVQSVPAVFSQKEKIVEEAGYRTTKQMVHELQLAGERYESFRRSEYYYDLPEGSALDDVPLPPLRSRNFTIVDASLLQKELEAKFDAHQEALKQEKASQASQEPSKAALEPSQASSAPEK
jgi:hypothetical protein